MDWIISKKDHCGQFFSKWELIANFFCSIRNLLLPKNNDILNVVLCKYFYLMDETYKFIQLKNKMKSLKIYKNYKFDEVFKNK